MSAARRLADPGRHGSGARGMHVNRSASADTAARSGAARAGASGATLSRAISRNRALRHLAGGRLRDPNDRPVAGLRRRLLPCDRRRGVRRRGEGRVRTVHAVAAVFGLQSGEVDVLVNGTSLTSSRALLRGSIRARTSTTDRRSSSRSRSTSARPRRSTARPSAFSREPQRSSTSRTSPVETTSSFGRS